MFLRFFLAIWASILLCIGGIVLFGYLVGEYPDTDFAEAYRRLTLLDLAEAAFRDDAGSAQRMVALAVNLDPPVALMIVALPDCSRAPEVLDGVREVVTPEGCVRLFVDGADPDAASLGPPLSVPVIGASLIGVMAALFLARQFARPIDTLSDGFRALSRGDLSVRIGGAMGGRRDEMGRLARDFDRMAVRLETLSDGRRRLFQDVSHELRSPLARLQATTGVLRQSPTKLGPMLARIEAEVGKLDHLVDEILTLARLDDRGAGSLVRRRIDLVDLVAPIVADASFEGQDRGVRCRYEGPDSIEGLVDPELCHRALENVIRNAVRHTAEGTEVTVGALVAPGAGGRPPRAVLTVEDREPGVGLAELESIFAPFHYASDAARPRGAGLGLAIARRAVEVHGGRPERACGRAAALW